MVNDGLAINDIEKNWICFLNNWTPQNQIHPNTISRLFVSIRRKSKFCIFIVYRVRVAINIYGILFKFSAMQSIHHRDGCCFFHVLLLCHMFDRMHSKRNSIMISFHTFYCCYSNVVVKVVVHCMQNWSYRRRLSSSFVDVINSLCAQLNGTRLLPPNSSKSTMQY